MIELYKAIWRSTGRRQIILIVLSLAIAGLAALPLEYQKNIINGLTDSSLTLNGLFYLCMQMAAVILLSLSLKWLLRYRANILGEDTIRRIRERICTVSSADPQNQEKIAKGTVATMVSAEAEEVGNFTGTAISEPLLNAATLVVLISYIAINQPVLGIIAFCMILPQVLIVFSVQIKVNKLVARRVHLLRHVTNQIVRGNHDLKAITAEFDQIYETRSNMFLWKQSSTFFISALNSAGTIAILLLGGWQVLEGNTDVGTIVAAIAGLTRIQGSATFLMMFYRQVSATSVKFELLQDSGIVRQASAATQG